MANSRHSIEGKHGTLLRLGEDNSTVSWGGSIELYSSGDVTCEFV